MCECYWMKVPYVVMCNVDNMWMLLDEGSIIRVCNVDNMWMLLDEGSIIKGV